MKKVEVKTFTVVLTHGQKLTFEVKRPGAVEVLALKHDSKVQSLAQKHNPGAESGAASKLIFQFLKLGVRYLFNVRLGVNTFCFFCEIQETCGEMDFCAYSLSSGNILLSSSLAIGLNEYSFQTVDEGSSFEIQSALDEMTKDRVYPASVASMHEKIVSLLAFVMSTSTENASRFIQWHQTMPEEFDKPLLFGGIGKTIVRRRNEASFNANGICLFGRHNGSFQSGFSMEKLHLTVGFDFDALVRELFRLFFADFANFREEETDLTKAWDLEDPAKIWGQIEAILKGNRGSLEEIFKKLYQVSPICSDSGILGESYFPLIDGLVFSLTRRQDGSKEVSATKYYLHANGAREAVRATGVKLPYTLASALAVRAGEVGNPISLLEPYGRVGDLLKASDGGRGAAQFALKHFVPIMVIEEVSKCILICPIIAKGEEIETFVTMGNWSKMGIFDVLERRFPGFLDDFKSRVSAKHVFYLQGLSEDEAFRGDTDNSRSYMFSISEGLVFFLRFEKVGGGSTTLERVGLQEDVLIVGQEQLIEKMRGSLSLGEGEVSIYRSNCNTWNYFYATGSDSFGFDLPQGFSKEIPFVFAIGSKHRSVMLRVQNDGGSLKIISFREIPLHPYHSFTFSRDSMMDEIFDSADSSPRRLLRHADL